MKVKVILLLTMIFFFQGPASAEAGVGEKVLGTTIKSAVKLYVAMRNLEKVKKKIIAEVEKADEKEFRIKYAKLYELAKGLPPDIKATYKITPDMTKAQLIKNVRSVDKKTIYKIINRIPDKTIAGLFKQYLREAGKKSPSRR